ncbi:peptidase inhibitor family I36 protein [Actinokineospora iranica]|uniref:Peptidase inhibitor family I36 n=1 Tax=Actinokineospora iranica TaxID=1271860 RepID=A0A1G6ZH06_9PSEU|nr:peptidase inhibitor family I36 protein [Actinokineospora iranica]SDE01537.1 Peptidase inhibitor family I36 [Actinokineospora iranica]
MRRLLSVLSGAVALSAGALVGPASADADRHCVANLDTQVVRCADTPAGAMRLATGPGALALTIAIFYDGTGYTGATYTWVQSRACTPTYDSEWQWGNLGDLGWNNRVSSVHTYNQCDVKFYDGFEFTGAASTWIDNHSDLGVLGWNNRAGSVKFS